eukprot:3529071-Rhodomonas_salina.2
MSVPVGLFPNAFLLSLESWTQSTSRALAEQAREGGMKEDNDKQRERERQRAQRMTERHNPPRFLFISLPLLKVQEGREREH